MLSVPKTVHRGNSFNGMLPVCKGHQNTYYLSVFSAGNTTLWRMGTGSGKRDSSNFLRTYSQKILRILSVWVILSYAH